MKTSAQQWLLFLALGAFSPVAQSQDDPLRMQVAAGIDFTSGDYGGSSDVTELYLPITGTIKTDRFGFRLTVPYLSVRAPAGTVLTDPAEQPAISSGSEQTESGLGDIIASITFYDLVVRADPDLSIDLTGKVKLGTADESRGLGTGENDYSLQLDFYRFIDRFTLLGSAGYKVRGDPPGINLRNVLFASVGGAYRLSPMTRVGLMGNFRQSALTGGESIRELSAFVSQKLNPTWQLQVSVLAGLSDNSADFGIGFQLKKNL